MSIVSPFHFDFCGIFMYYLCQRHKRVYVQYTASAFSKALGLPCAEVNKLHKNMRSDHFHYAVNGYPTKFHNYYFSEDTSTESKRVKMEIVRPHLEGMNMPTIPQREMNGKGSNHAPNALPFNIIGSLYRNASIAFPLPMPPPHRHLSINSHIALSPFPLRSD